MHDRPALTLEERERLLDQDVIEEAGRLRALGVPPELATHAALGLPKYSPRPVAVPALRSPSPPSSHAPAGVFSNERGGASSMCVDVGDSARVNARPAPFDWRRDGGVHEVAGDVRRVDRRLAVRGWVLAVALFVVALVVIVVASIASGGE